MSACGVGRCLSRSPLCTQFSLVDPSLTSPPHTHAVGSTANSREANSLCFQFRWSDLPGGQHNQTCHSLHIEPDAAQDGGGPARASPRVTWPAAFLLPRLCGDVQALKVAFLLPFSLSAVNVASARCSPSAVHNEYSRNLS